MKKNKKIAQKQRTGFEVPTNYFNSFEDKLFKNLPVNKAVNAQNKTGFNIPNHYFENFDEHLFDASQIPKPSKVIKLWSYQNLAYATSVAAAVILVITLVFNSQKTLDFESLEVASIQNYIETTDFSTYDIASLLTDNELTSELISQESISDQALENYLIERTNFEDLLID